MKKHGILNSHISEVLSRLGHTDTIVIADCGLPIPDETIRIDISLKQGDPSFMEVLEAVIDDMVVEKITLATEMKEHNSLLEEKVLKTVNSAQVDYIPHDVFKLQTKSAKAVIRTGEVTPYANIILHAGVIF